MQTEIIDSNLIIRLPLEEPRPSKSEKTLIHATTHGNQSTGLQIDGKPLFVSVNAYTYAKPKAGREEIMRAEIVA